MRIDLKCACGASVVLDDPARSYVVTGGAPSGPRQRRFQIEVLADDWLDRHYHCLGVTRHAATTSETRHG